MAKEIKFEADARQRRCLPASTSSRRRQKVTLEAEKSITLALLGEVLRCSADLNDSVTRGQEVELEIPIERACGRQLVRRSGRDRRTAITAGDNSFPDDTLLADVIVSKYLPGNDHQRRCPGHPSRHPGATDAVVGQNQNRHTPSSTKEQMLSRHHFRRRRRDRREEESPDWRMPWAGRRHLRQEGQTVRHRHGHRRGHTCSTERSHLYVRGLFMKMGRPQQSPSSSTIRRSPASRTCCPYRRDRQSPGRPPFIIAEGRRRGKRAATIAEQAALSFNCVAIKAQHRRSPQKRILETSPPSQARRSSTRTSA